MGEHFPAGLFCLIDPVSELVEAVFQYQEGAAAISRIKEAERLSFAEAARETPVLVAHRLSTVTQADRIVVMDAGRVRSVGTHAELTARDQLYAQLTATQLLATAR